MSFFRYAVILSAFGTLAAQAPAQADIFPNAAPTPGAARGAAAPVPVEAPESPTGRKAGEAYASAIALAQGGDRTGAIQAYTTVIAMEPSFAQAHFERGVVKGESNDPNGAVIDFATAAARAPRLSWLRSQALYERAKTLAALMDYSRAVSDATDSLTNRPDFADALALRAFAQNELGQPYLALDDASDALSLDPGSASARLERARAHMTLRKPGPAIDDCTALIDSLGGVTPGSGEAPLAVRALVARGQARDSIGQIRPAIADFSAALALQPNSYDALLARSIALSRLGRHAEALRDCERAIAVAPPYTRTDSPAHRLLPSLREFAGQATASAPTEGK